MKLEVYIHKDENMDIDCLCLECWKLCDNPCEISEVIYNQEVEDCMKNKGNKNYDNIT